MSTDQALTRALQSPPACVYLVTGGAGLLVERAVKALTDWLLPMVGPPSFNFASMHGSDPNAADAIGLARTPAMMADRRVVIVRELDAAKEPFFTALDAYLDAPSPDCTLILCGAGFPKVEKGGKNWSARLAKKLVAPAVVSLSYSESSVRPADLVVETALALGHRIAPGDAHLLVAIVGPNLGQLVCEVEKTCLYVDPGADLTPDAITAACSAVAEQDVWGLTGALARGDRGTALAALHRLVADGDSAHRLLGLVVWQMRTMLRVAEILRQGGTEGQAMGETRARPEMVRAVRSMLRRGKMTAAPMLTRLARTHRSMNGMKGGAVRVLESLVLELTS